MSKLHLVRSTHYGPKDYHEALENYLIADSEEQVLQWICKHHHRWGGNFGGKGSVEPSPKRYSENPDAIKRAADLGLTLDRHGVLHGAWGDVLRFWRGDFEAPQDLHYGATQYHWDAGRDVDEREITTLLHLGIAVDVR